MVFLVGCERSGVLREALRARGLEAWSCDIEPAEDGSRFHIQDDIRKVAPHKQWRRAIMHPECTFMTLSGAKHLYLNHGSGEPLIKNEERWEKMRQAAAFMRWMLELPYPVVCENPTMLAHAQRLLPVKWFCSTQPYFHGDEATKRTFFWRNSTCFSPLKDSARLVLPAAGSQERKRWESVWREPPGDNRKANRSRSFPGMMRAVAEQWGG